MPLDGWGPHYRLRPKTIGGAGSEHPWDAEGWGLLHAAPEPHTGWRGDLFSLPQKPLPPGLVPHTANELQATDIRRWQQDAAIVRRLPPNGGNTKLTVAHF